MGLTDRLQTEIEEVPVLGINHDEVSIFYPNDFQQEGLGQELIARIDGLFIKPERTEEVITNLREAICNCLEEFALKHVPQCYYIEAFVASMVKPEDCSVRKLDLCPTCNAGNVKCTDCGGVGRKRK